jgi:hypothetical protein
VYYPANTQVDFWCFSRQAAVGYDLPISANPRGEDVAFARCALILAAMNELSPPVSEFETVEQAEAYLHWLESKVAASKADGRPMSSMTKR